MRKSIRGVLCGVAAIGMLTSTISAADMTAYMAYRQNEVCLTGGEGIAIDSGTFIVSDLKITEGQDPDHRNDIGQVYTLDNGVFTFEVGRSGSETVADWFNEKFSGYNDPSVNGDRTTFDHTAGELNFAFVGDLELSITSADYPGGLSVTFPNVAFAQGSTLFSNNWWFAQSVGQHTRDSDGPDTLLVTGYTEEGDTVFASFLRGDNDVNEISLEAVCVVDPARDSAWQAGDVQEQFSGLPDYGTQVNLEGFPGSYDPTVNHIQGYARYPGADNVQYAILTHSVGTADYAHIVAGPESGDEKWGFKTYLKDWRHPGGVQVIGDYMFVPTEQDTSAHIALYDLRTLQVNELRRVETFDLAVDHKAGALAVTSYTDESGAEYYVLIVAHLDGENTVYYVYRADAAEGIEAAEFEAVGSFPLNKDFQGFGLVTEESTNDIYMVGLWSPTEGATFADYAYLYQLNTDSWTVGEALDQCHLTSVGGIPGMWGVHFRYGASVDVSQQGVMTLSATERNSVLGSSLVTNNWTAVMGQ